MKEWILVIFTWMPPNALPTEHYITTSSEAACEQRLLEVDEMLAQQREVYPDFGYVLSCKERDSD